MIESILDGIRETRGGTDHPKLVVSNARPCGNSEARRYKSDEMPSVEINSLCSLNQGVCGGLTGSGQSEAGGYWRLYVGPPRSKRGGLHISARGPLISLGVSRETRWLSPSPVFCPR